MFMASFAPPCKLAYIDVTDWATQSFIFFMAKWSPVVHNVLQSINHTCNYVCTFTHCTVSSQASQFSACSTSERDATQGRSVGARETLCHVTCRCRERATNSGTCNTLCSSTFKFCMYTVHAHVDREWIWVMIYSCTRGGRAHGWPLLIRSLMRVPLLGVARSRAQFRSAHNSFIGLTWLLSLSLDLSVYQGRLLAIHLVWYKLSAKNCYICAHYQEGYLISDLHCNEQRSTVSDLLCSCTCQLEYV